MPDSTTAPGAAMVTPKKPPNRIIWYSFILLGILVVPSVLIPIMLENRKPAFDSLDTLPPEQITKLEVRLFNISHIVPTTADGGRPPDTIGPFVVKPEDMAGLLSELKNARQLQSMPPTPWLGEFRFTLADGKTQTVRIRFGGGNPDQGVPHRIHFQISRDLIFETNTTVNSLVNKAAEAEKRAKGL